MMIQYEKKDWNERRQSVGLVEGQKSLCNEILGFLLLLIPNWTFKDRYRWFYYCRCDSAVPQGGRFGDIFIDTHADLSRVHTEHYVLASTTATCFNRAILFGIWLILNVSGVLKGGGHPMRLVPSRKLRSSRHVNCIVLDAPRPR